MSNFVIGMASDGVGTLKIHRFKFSLFPTSRWAATCGNKVTKGVTPTHDGQVCRSCFKHGKIKDPK